MQNNRFLLILNEKEVPGHIKRVKFFLICDLIQFLFTPSCGSDIGRMGKRQAFWDYKGLSITTNTLLNVFLYGFPFISCLDRTC